MLVGYGKEYQVIVVGAGHAGCEAALATARMGCSTLLLTMGLDTVAMMSCNPAIGGLAKGHLVHEVDALGGEMAHNIDATAIQFRRLNTRKGPAVRATRAQADRMAYSARMKRVLEAEELLDLKQGVVTSLKTKGGRVFGVCTREGIDFDGDTVVLTTGTFMRGLIHVGLNNYSGGRAGEPASEGLSDCLRDLGFRVGRLKTGTPARLSARSIDFSKLEKQHGDTVIRPFSFLSEKIEIDQAPCHIAYTNDKTHEIIRKNLDRSPLYSGVIEGVGPRYCPSIGDKVVRFGERSAHQTFLEPEGRQSDEVYPSGMSTSLPPDVQIAFYRSMVGLEQVEIMRPGYAIEYDFVEPTQLRPTLEAREVQGLYHAGQVNGTSGYEEAAGQGLLAGINAALASTDRDQIVVGRDEAYLGVMVDDLVTQLTQEPYRMFTSRSEYRLLLREDNADVRLTELGRKVGLVSDKRWDLYQNKQEQFRHGKELLSTHKVKPSNFSAIESLNLSGLRNGVTLEELLRRPELGVDQLTPLCEGLGGLSRAVLEQLEIATKYEGYIDRQLEQVARFRELEGVRIPDTIKYDQVHGISSEVREKLTEVRPETLGQAGRIQGVTPAAIAVLHIYLRKKYHA